jgi:hypothetical protein
MAFGGGERDEAERRQQSMTERRKGDETDAEQNHHHHGRPDIRDVVEHRGGHPENRRVGKPQEKRSDADDDP